MTNLYDPDLFGVRKSQAQIDFRQEGGEERHVPGLESGRTVFLDWKDVRDPMGPASENISEYRYITNEGRIAGFPASKNE